MSFEVRSFRALTLCLCVTLVRFFVHAEPTPPYGLDARPVSMPYLSMPPLADGKLPPLLSQTGAFKDTRHLVPSGGLIPYELIVPFWSDGADKARWISVPP